MNYAKAKELKDAGFPQYIIEKGQGYYIDYSPSDGGITQDVLLPLYIPTLEELIEACGKYVTLVDVGPNWRAYIGPESDCDGSTPSEAVANLYLELNKK